MKRLISTKYINNIELQMHTCTRTHTHMQGNKNNYHCLNSCFLGIKHDKRMCFDVNQWDALKKKRITKKRYQIYKKNYNFFS